MAILAAVIVVVTLIVMTTGRQPAVLALICALVVAGLAGIATPAELFAGLSNGGVITIAAMLVIAKGVLYTGVITRVTHRLLNGVTTATQTLARLVPPVGVASALINTTPIVAMLIPATKELERQSAVPARGVLLPIAHATTLAGSATLIGTSSNLLIAGIADPAGVELTMFSSCRSLSRSPWSAGRCCSCSHRGCCAVPPNTRTGRWSGARRFPLHAAPTPSGAPPPPSVSLPRPTSSC